MQKPVRIQQGWIHGQYQSRTGGQGRKCTFFPLFDLCSRTDGPTNQPTDGRTDGPTDQPTYRVACTRLKRQILIHKLRYKQISTWNQFLTVTRGESGLVSGVFLFHLLIFMTILTFSFFSFVAQGEQASTNLRMR